MAPTTKPPTTREELDALSVPDPELEKVLASIFYDALSSPPVSLPP